MRVDAVVVFITYINLASEQLGKLLIIYLRRHLSAQDTENVTLLANHLDVACSYHG